MSKDTLNQPTQSPRYRVQIWELNDLTLNNILHYIYQKLNQPFKFDKNRIIYFFLRYVFHSLEVNSRTNIRFATSEKNYLTHDLETTNYEKFELANFFHPLTC